MSYTRVLMPVTVMIALFNGPAWAYMDPGSGSLLLQIILGGLAGLAVAGKLFWHRILVMFGVRRERRELDSEPANADDA